MDTTKQAEKRLREFLRDLGPTADSIAAKLRTLEVKGWLSDPFSCPLAAYLERCGYERPSVTPRCGITVSVPTSVEGITQAVTVGPTSAQKAFIRRFDKGRYPDLEKEPEDAVY
jgi:hypothetical protein